MEARRRGRSPTGAMPVSQASSVPSATATSPPGSPPRKPPARSRRSSRSPAWRAHHRPCIGAEEEADRDEGQRDAGERGEQRGARRGLADALGRTRLPRARSARCPRWPRAPPARPPAPDPPLRGLGRELRRQHDQEDVAKSETVLIRTEARTRPSGRWRAPAASPARRRRGCRPAANRGAGRMRP